MAAYVILNVEVTDPSKYEEYRRLGASTLAAYGAKGLVRGGRAEALEGDWSPDRLVMIEFESIEQAKQWWTSKEYSEARELRHQCAVTHTILVEGI